MFVSAFRVKVESELHSGPFFSARNSNRTRKPKWSNWRKKERKKERDFYFWNAICGHVLLELFMLYSQFVFRVNKGLSARKSSLYASLVINDCNEFLASAKITRALLCPKCRIERAALVSHEFSVCICTSPKTVLGPGLTFTLRIATQVNSVTHWK